ncbi:MAG: hypothetical protein ACI8X5_001186 [Planctomycetota bacterium]|jgi:hypothetical protein
MTSNLVSVPLLLIAALGASLSAAERSLGSTQEPSSDAKAKDERAIKLKRVLHLTNGSTLRTLSYFAGGTWQVRRNSEWITIDGHAVHSWRGELEIKKQASALERQLGPKDNGRRIEFAKWLKSEGFVEEATEEIDCVLRLAPDFAPALHLLSERGFPRFSTSGAEEDPASHVARLFNAGVSASAVDRELIIQSLSPLLEDQLGNEALRKSLRKELHAARILRRTFAAHALRRLYTGQEMFAIMQRCVLDTSQPVRQEAALALAATGEPGIIIPLVKSLSSQSREVRTNAAESLGNVGFKTAVPALVSHFANLSAARSSVPSDKVAAHIYIGKRFSYVGDFDLEIAQGSAIADPIVFRGEEGILLDVRLGGISGYTYKTEYRSVYDSLKQLTSENPGSSPSDWSRWYEEHKSQFASTK